MARGRPIVIEFAANVRDWLRGTRQAEDSLEDLADEIDDATKDAEKFEDRFEDSMRSAAKDADRAARDIGRDFGKVEREMGDIGKEGASEFKQNLSETLSSGGGVEDIVQDTLGGLVSGLEGALGGVLAGVAGVAAIMFQKAREEAELQMQLMIDMADAAYDHMKELQRSILTNKDAADLLVESVDANQEQWAKIQKLAEEAGIDWAAAGEAVIEGGLEAEEVYDRLRQIIKDNTETGARGVQNVEDEAAAARELLGLFQDVEGAVQDAAGDYQRLEDAMRRTADYSDDIQRNLRHAQDYADGIRGNLPYRGGNVPL